MITELQLTNFKSITNEPIKLGNLNAFIGANAAGKTNFVDSLQFIRDIKVLGLSSAVARRYGWQNTLRRGLDQKEKISAKIKCDCPQKLKGFEVGRKKYKFIDLEYEITAAYSGRKFYIDSERYHSRSQYQDGKVEEAFERTLRSVKISAAIFPYALRRGRKIPITFDDQLFIDKGFPLITADLLSTIIDNWRFYDFDVNSARKPCVDEGQEVLQRDGSNLALVLDKLTRSRKENSRRIRERIQKIMRNLIPSFENWKTEKQFDSSISFTIYEAGIKKTLLPRMISDGTVRLLSILVALFGQPHTTDLICIDEPERYLHPQVFEPLIQLMRDISNEKQIIVTTHSAELVKHLRPSEVFMVDKVNNATRIVNAQDVQMIDKFLKEFSLDELWLKGYLEGGRIS